MQRFWTLCNCDGGWEGTFGEAVAVTSPSPARWCCRYFCLIIILSLDESVPDLGGRRRAWRHIALEATSDSKRCFCCILQEQLSVDTSIDFVSPCLYVQR